MKIKLLAIVFVLRWTTQEAKPNNVYGFVGDAFINQPACHIENVDHEERFSDEREARSELAYLEAEGKTPVLYRVQEEPIK